MRDSELQRAPAPAIQEGELVHSTFSVATSGEGDSFFDYLRSIWERRLVVAGITLAAILAAVLYCVTATPVYQASAQLAIEPENPNVLAFKPVIEEETSKSDYYQTQYQLLRSRTLARTTLDRLKLWTHPDFVARPDWGGAMAQHLIALAATRTEAQVVDAAPGEPPEPTESVAELQAIGRFLANLTIEPVRGSRLLNVRFLSSDPVVSRNVVNTLLRAHIERTLDFRSAASREALRWLNLRLAQQRKLVEESEHALQQYLEDTSAGSAVERQTVIGQRLADMNAALTRARAERIGREAMYEQLQRLRDDSSAELPISSPALEVLRNERAALRRKEAQLALELGDRHPDLIEVRAAVGAVEDRLEAETQRYLDAARKDVLADQIRESNLQRALEAEKAQAMVLEKKGIEYSVLQREAESNRQMFQSLLQRTRETSISGELNTSNVRIVDEASLPLSSVAPRKRVILPLAAVGGLGLGAICAMLLGVRDDRIKSPAHLRRRVSLRFLGFAPAVSRRTLSAGELQIDPHRASAYTEALRVVRTNLSFCLGDATPRIVLVTSSVRGEGKSMIAGNLAVALSQANQRVLVVDGDLRRPRQHLLFGVERGPGLAEYLGDHVVQTPLLQTTQVPRVSVMAAGMAVDNAADLLGFNPVVRLTQSFGRNFDWIVIDTPPVSEVTDACLFARGEARVLFVVAANQVSGELVQAAVARLAATDAEFAGAVLSRVRTGDAGGGY